MSCCDRIERVAMLSVHTSPLEQPGTGDAGGMNVYVVEVAHQLARRGVEVEIYDDLEKMLAIPGLDVVCICTPSGAHLEPAVQAAHAGKHVVVEKPLEITLARCDAIIDACADHHPDSGAMQRQPHADPDEDRGGENNQPHHGILQEDRFAV